MPDVVTPEARSRMMRGIRGRDTKPELAVRRYLHARGYRYRLHDKRLPGKPDVVLPRHRAVVFVHGCFWHRHEGCRFAYHPKSRQDFWEAKLTGNAQRDARDRQRLSDLGWTVHTVWECEVTEDNLATLATRIAAAKPMGA